MANPEGLVLDSLDLNAGNFTLEELDLGNATKRLEWIVGIDADGAALLRDPLTDNRVVTARIRVGPRTTMDLALADVGSLVDKLEEAERQPDGVALVYTPATATKTFTLYVLSGEITDVPISITSGWLVKSPLITVKLTCKPFGYGAEVTGSTVTNANAYQTVAQGSVSGDVPAEARVVITDNASKDRRHVEVGIQYRYYDAGTSLELDSDDMTAVGGTATTRSGAYDPGASGNSVIRATLGVQPTTVCSTGNLGHVGVFRVKARVYASALDVRVRLNWQEGSGSFRPNPWAAPAVAGGFSEIDLGLIAIPPKVLGTQRWTGRIEAYTTAPGDTVDIDVLWLVPAGEGYGVARGIYTYQPGALVGRDEFTGATSTLNGRSAPSGGTWATSGATTDFDAGVGSGSD